MTDGQSSGAAVDLAHVQGIGQARVDSKRAATQAEAPCASS
jgi:hypothetical protein